MNSGNRPADLLDKTLAVAVRDVATVSAEGVPLTRLTHGVTVRRLITHSDFRGSVTELFDPRWREYSDPLRFSYTFTIRPGMAKGLFAFLRTRAELDPARWADFAILQP